MPETTSGPDPAGEMSEFEKDNLWYESYADQVHTFGKQWPEPLTAEEAAACAAYADSKVRRPISEMWDVENEN